jgi:hypothetical protein
MSGPQLTALVATVVALVALSGVGLLVLQLRRLRAEVAEARSAVVAPAPVPAEMPGTGRAEPEPPDPGPGPADERGTVVEMLPEPDGEALRRDVVVSPGVQALVEPVARRLVQVSAVSFGVRRALRAENRDRVAALVRRDLRRRRKLRQRAARRAFRVVPLRDTDEVQPDGRQDWAS